MQIFSLFDINSKVTDNFSSFSGCVTPARPTLFLNSYSLFMSKYVWLYNFILEHSFGFRSKLRVLSDIKPKNFVLIYIYVCIYRSRIVKGCILYTKVHVAVPVHIYCLEGCNSALNMNQSLLRGTPQRFHTNKLSCHDISLIWKKYYFHYTHFIWCRAKTISNVNIVEKFNYVSIFREIKMFTWLQILKHHFSY